MNLSTPDRKAVRPTVNSASINQRLEDLLKGPLPSKTPCSFSRNPTGTTPLGHPQPSRDCRSEIELPTPRNYNIPNNAVSTPELPRAIEEPVVQSTHGATHEPRPTSIGNETSEESSEERARRSAPTSGLKLSDFEINPANNQSIDFAYKSVVRKKDERKCIPGCVSEDCCGPKFRRMALSLPCTKEEAERILEDYLGDEKHILEHISGHAREELLLEARTWFLANRYGRHRENRQPSPPGFWRTDMPDTQEMERDHAEAEKLEHKTIMARHREAMRPGGLWKFANQK